MTTRYVSFLVVPLAPRLFATGKLALTLFVGQAYAEGSEPLMVLTLIFAVTAFATTMAPTPLTIDKTGASSPITGFFVAVSLSMGYLLALSWECWVKRQPRAKYDHQHSVVDFIGAKACHHENRL